MPELLKKEKFIVRIIKIGFKNWWKILIALTLGGFLISSCEIPTPWGMLKKGGINMPWGK